MCISGEMDNTNILKNEKEEEEECNKSQWLSYTS